MKKQLLLSTILTAALAVGTAHAAGMDKSTDASSSQSGSVQSGQLEGSSQGMSGQAAQITDNPDAVRQIQQALKDQGADIQVDGVWGPSTEQALMDFQKDQGQGNATGQPDQETLQALDVDIAQGQPQTAETPSGSGASGSTGMGSGGMGSDTGTSTPNLGTGSGSMGSGGTTGQDTGTGSGSSSGSGSSQ